MILQNHEVLVLNRSRTSWICAKCWIEISCHLVATIDQAWEQIPPDIQNDLKESLERCERKLDAMGERPKENR
jgi:hypothetical protein